MIRSSCLWVVLVVLAGCGRILVLDDAGNTNACIAACGVGCASPGTQCYSDGQSYCSACAAACSGATPVACVDAGSIDAGSLEGCLSGCGAGCSASGSLCYSDGRSYCSPCTASCYGIDTIACTATDAGAPDAGAVAACVRACGVGCSAPGSACYADGRSYCSPCTAACYAVATTTCVTPDSGAPDSGTRDSGTPDSGAPDAGSRDAGSTVEACVSACGAGCSAPGSLCFADGHAYCSVCAAACYGTTPVACQVDGGANRWPYAPYALEILQPAAGLDTHNRFYKAYPGLEYNVSAAVAGGAYPYVYALDVAPSGMTIDPTTGAISWPQPPARGTPYAATLRVTDSLGTTATVSWTITVTTAGFAFVDAHATNASDTNAGTIDAPWKTFAGVYGGITYDDKYSTKNQYKFVYFKNGTYEPDGFAGTAHDSEAVQWTSNQPVVFLAYPGHAPIIDFDNRYFRADTTTHNFYLDGFECRNVDQAPNNVNVPGEYYFAFRLVGSSNNTTIRKNHFHHIDGSNGGSNNQSFIMYAADDNGAKGQRNVVVNNEFNDSLDSYGVIGYTTTKLLFADNVLHDFTGNSHPIGPKDSCDHWFIRNNRIYDVDTRGIWLNGTNDRASYGDMEISFNNVQARDNAIYFYEGMRPTTGTTQVFRNTFVGSVVFRQDNQTVLSHNVIVNTVDGGVSIADIQSINNVTRTNNLTNTPASGLVDAEGRLTNAYKQYVGTHGWE